MGGKVYAYSGPRKPDSIEAFARSNWRKMQGEVLPKDRPLSERIMKRIASHAFLIFGVTMVGLIAWTCCGSKPTEEQRERRRRFEEKLAQMEKLHSERIRAEKEGKK